MSSRALAVIPARGGSRRVPGKNVKLLAGKPAIVYTIEAAIASDLFDRIVVSTDSKSIADIAVAAGAEVPFVREAALSGDHTAVSDVTVDALMRVDPDAAKYDFICQLMANCPLRNADDIVSSYRQFSESGAGAQISVTSYGWFNPWWAVERDADFRLKHILPEALGKRSQDLPDVYCPTGAVWWARSEVLRKERNFHTDDKRGWEMPWYRAVDIDSEEDWRMAEALLKMAARKGVEG
ncbi:MAG: acylneuraminate cytidylyltransferase family protein [Gemmatimonadaceae bacterium]|nr:acylneuraminate cytidylyltransferase family protein [Gemmatimonadaceae bacterium]